MTICRGLRVSIKTHSERSQTPHVTPSESVISNLQITSKSTTDHMFCGKLMFRVRIDKFTFFPREQMQRSSHFFPAPTMSQVSSVRIWAAWLRAHFFGTLRLTTCRSLRDRMKMFHSILGFADEWHGSGSALKELQTPPARQFEMKFSPQSTVSHSLASAGALRHD